MIKYNGYISEENKNILNMLESKLNEELLQNENVIQTLLLIFDEMRRILHEKGIDKNGINEKIEKFIKNSVKNDGYINCDLTSLFGYDYMYNIYIDNNGLITVDKSEFERAVGFNRNTVRKFHKTGIQMLYKDDTLVVERDSSFVLATIYRLRKDNQKEILGKCFTNQIGLIENNGVYNQTEEGGLLLNGDVFSDIRWNNQKHLEQVFIKPPKDENELSLIQTELLLRFFNFLKNGLQSRKTQFLEPNNNNDSSNGWEEVPLITISKDLLKNCDDVNVKKAINDINVRTALTKGFLEDAKMKQTEFIAYCLSTGLLLYDQEKKLKINFPSLVVNYDDFDYEMQNQGKRI